MRALCCSLVVPGTRSVVGSGSRRKKAGWMLQLVVSMADSAKTKRRGMELVKVAVDLADPNTHSRVAVVAGGKSHTYAQLLRSACVLAAAEGMVNGARVGIMAKPGPEFVAGMWAAWMSGAVAVPLALSYPEAELMHVLTDAGVSLVLASQEWDNLLQPITRACSARLLLHTGEEGDGEGGEVRFPEVEVGEDDAALIIYTSGTTGKPKGVVHSHGGLVAQARMLVQAWEYSPLDRMLNCLPLHHVHGVMNALLAPLYAGASVELLPRFSTRGVWQRWRDEAGTGATVFTGVPTMYVRLLQGYEGMEEEDRQEAGRAAGKLRLMMCGSSALPESVMKRWEEVTGHRLLERYGMTELGMALSNPLRGERRAGCVGTPLPGVEIKLEGEGGDGGGELCVKSASLFKEYWGKPEATRESFTEDGFFKTGDSVVVEEGGYVKILGRMSVDILKSGGYKLSALEIEAVLLQHPAVQECAVLGLPDEDYGEIICAIVMPNAAAAAEASGRGEAALTLHQLHAWAVERIAPYKIPQQLHIWEWLPRNAMGKVNKKELKQLLLKQQQGAGC